MENDNRNIELVLDILQVADDIRAGHAWYPGCNFLRTLLLLA